MAEGPSVCRLLPLWFMEFECLVSQHPHSEYLPAFSESHESLPHGLDLLFTGTRPGCSLQCPYPVGHLS